MPTLTIYAALAAFAAALAALIIYHLAVVAPALRRAHALADTEGTLGAEQATLKRVVQQVSELEGLARTDLSRVGFVRYDAFEDTGSELSYALALLNREGDGVVISSIYSRTDTRTYGKAVHGYKPAVNASEEELRAIERARSAQA
ncbi:MAG TPA: DUF4446 family protein [Candidatus Baltobacteraceae bacterium]|nr:DUF4446 family protein [Candidatus Baltobacteraceae bacterium]